MNSQPPLRQVTYVICIWREPQHDGAFVWRGALETKAGQRFEFARLAELEYLLCEVGGWIDPDIVLQQGDDGGPV